MPQEVPVKCAGCSNEELVHGLRLGRLNGVMANLGGPGQEPPPMGIQWAVYLCPKCGYIGPYKKNYSSQQTVQIAYEKLTKICKEYADIKKVPEEAIKQLESMRDSRKVLSVLPGAMGSNEAMISSIVAPLRERIDQLEADAKRFEAEIQKRKGGRPKGSPNKPKDGDQDNG